MINKEQWIKDWRIGNNSEQTSIILIEEFMGFLLYLKNMKKLSKRTIKRHETSCHALGGYIINDLYNSIPTGNSSKSGKDILLDYIIQYEGPLIYHDNEDWQKEVDATCKHLYKYLHY